MFAHIKRYAGAEIKAWAIVDEKRRGPALVWLVTDIIVQWGGYDDWGENDLDYAYLEPLSEEDKFTLFKPEDKRVPAKVVAEFMRRALLCQSS